MMTPPDIGDWECALLTDGLYQLVDMLVHGGYPKILEVPYGIWLER